MKIAIASDHAGFELKKYLISALNEFNPNIEVLDMGAETYDEHDDYPDYVKKVGTYVSENNDAENFRGIVIGGSGQGENISANKHRGVRSILVYGNDMPLNAQIAKLSREHNDANVISFGARFIDENNAFELLKIWLDTPFSNEERHIRRISKIEQ